MAASPDSTRVFNMARLDELLEERGWTAKRLTREAKLNPTAISDIRKGKSRNPRSDTVDRIAAALGVQSSELIFSNVQGNTQSGLVKLPQLPRRTAIVGTVQAGSWLEADLRIAADEEFVDYIDVGQFQAKTVAYRVVGDSMDLAGMPDGSILICADWVERGAEMETGKFVVVQRERDGGHLIELTVKEMRVFGDRFELHPHSTNATHKPIIVPRGKDDEIDQHVVKILAEVMFVMTRPMKPIARAEK